MAIIVLTDLQGDVLRIVRHLSGHNGGGGGGAFLRKGRLEDDSSRSTLYHFCGYADRRRTGKPVDSRGGEAMD